MVQLIKATENDLNTITSLAIDIWNEHYIPIIGKLQVDYMLSKMYNYESLKEQMFIKKHDFYLIEIDNKVNGFISISTENNLDYFINKFYVNQNQSNKGIGSIVLKQLELLFKPHTMRLTVNRQNYKSINFYFKNGFIIKSVEDFDIGDGYVMNDFIMEKKSYSISI